MNLNIREINCGNFTLQSWRKGFESDLVKYASDKRIWDQLRDRFPHPYTMNDAELWIEIANGHFPIRNFAIVYEQEVIGGVGVQMYEDIFRIGGEIGYWVAAPFWGKGIMTKALVAMTEYAIEHLKLERLEAYVFSHNIASIRVLEKAGYTLEAVQKRKAIKNRQLTDILLYTYIKPE